jgi:hypothetical protein
VTWRKRKEALKVVNSFELLDLVLLVDTICILELDHPLAGDEVDAGRKSRDLDDMSAVHLVERMILKSQHNFPEHSIRSFENVLILESLCVSSHDLCWVG